MAKEKKLFSVQIELNDRDYEDVFRIYLRHERGNEKKIGLLTSIVLLIGFLIMIYVTKRIAFLFYGLFCFAIGLSYYLVPVNRKFLATNKLQYGERQEIGFCPHKITTEEIFEDDEDSDQEYEDAESGFSTITLHAYENDRGFLFADGKIVNQFLYLPKRCLDEEEIEKIRDFAQNRCSGGYKEVETMIAEGDKKTRAAKTDAVCDKYYGASKLRLYDDDGNRVHMDDGGEEPDAPDQDTELDVEEEWARIISEDEDE